MLSDTELWIEDTGDVLPMFEIMRYEECEEDFITF